MLRGTTRSFDTCDRLLITLSVLLSVDTLKTCVVVDALTRTRHDSNRVLLSQGIGNVASACVGGFPGAGTMGATLVNLDSGGQTRLSGMLEGVFVLDLSCVLAGLTGGTAYTLSITAYGNTGQYSGDYGGDLGSMARVSTGYTTPTIGAPSACSCGRQRSHYWSSSARSAKRSWTSRSRD